MAVIQARLGEGRNGEMSELIRMELQHHVTPLGL